MSPDFIDVVKASWGFGTAAAAVVTGTIGGVLTGSLGGVSAGLVIGPLCSVSYAVGHLLACDRITKALSNGLLDMPFNADKTVATNSAGIEFISPAVAQSICDLVDTHGHRLNVADMPQCVRDSIDRRDGIFRESEFIGPGGFATGRKTGEYELTPRWRQFSNNAEALRRIRKKAGR